MLMYLKALEIQGFKSFPDKTVLHFDGDITVIVGPNGSGKSNISDAICWVMGEQSVRSLRGSKMEDVIFGGTEKRGQVGFAQVTLVLDNSEHIFPAIDSSEVMVTRRYYRSGESEYYINKQSVRLRDINELFMDTGLGREGYSIIGQGRIDEILSVKSADRREIFEEAAGISKYRHRKEESERKLERTEENLVRINDKIAELELQVEPLRAQAEKARRYLILRDELRLLEISVWLEKLEEIRTGAIKLQADYTAAKQRSQEAKDRLEALYAENEAFSQRMQENDLAQERVRSEASDLDGRAADQESAIAVLRTTVQHNQESIQLLERELADQDSRSATIGEQLAEQCRRCACRFPQRILTAGPPNWRGNWRSCSAKPLRRPKARAAQLPRHSPFRADRPWLWPPPLMNGPGWPPFRPAWSRWRSAEEAWTRNWPPPKSSWTPPGGMPGAPGRRWRRPRRRRRRPAT